MKTIKIASIGETKKVCYDAKNDRYNLPERFRATAKVGDHALIVNKEYNEVEKNEDGTNKTDAAGKFIPTGKKFTRDDVTMVGELKDVLIAKNEDRILAGVEDAVVKAESIKLAKEFNLGTVAEMEDKVGVS